MCGAISIQQRRWWSLQDLGRLLGYYFWFSFGLLLLNFIPSNSIKFAFPIFIVIYFVLQMRDAQKKCCDRRSDSQKLLSGFLPTLAFCPSIFFILAISMRPLSSGNFLIPALVWLISLPSVHVGRRLISKLNLLDPRLRYVTVFVVAAMALHHILWPHSGNDLLIYLNETSDQVKALCNY
jgi:hypothetical protein